MAVTAKEAFWKEHQDSLIRIRSQLSSHGKSTPGNRRTPTSQGRKQRPLSNPSHPPLGKYRRTPPPYLPRVGSPGDVGHTTPPLRGNKYDLVPPVKPKQAFTRPKPDYDSWGEESDDDDDDNRRLGLYKPKPYPQPSPMMMGAPFSMYYPPPPKGRNKRSKSRKDPVARGYKDLYQDRQTYEAVAGKKRKKQKRGPAGMSMPFFMPMPMMPMMMSMDGKYKYIYGEEESSDEEMNPLKHLTLRPLFAEDYVNGLVKELLEEEIIPDVLMEALNEYDAWVGPVHVHHSWVEPLSVSPKSRGGVQSQSYDHPAYLPTLYCCEDVMMEAIKEMVDDIVREVTAELTDDYLDEKRLKQDPLEEFLGDLLEEAVDWGVRGVVRQCVLDMSQQYLQDQAANRIYTNLFTEELHRAVPGVLEDIQLDQIIGEFIETEVIAPEAEEEAAVVATEILHHYDNKVTKREFKEVSKKANGQLADSLLMGYMLSVIAHQGKIWTQDDYAEHYLDDVILSLAMEHYYGVQKEKDKTLDNKPLKKLHEKAFTEVALDVCLQQLTASLDEDLADVDEYEQGLMDEAGHPIKLSESV